MPLPSTTQRGDIQGLRAVAVGTVVAGHAGLVGFGGGFVGVDVFFVISGYLITSLLLRDLHSGGISLLTFYARRARRILPATTTVIVAVVAFVALNRSSAVLESTTTDAWWSLAFLANIHFGSADVDYFSSTDLVSPLQHFWSLAVEEQFYLVWPLLLAVLLRGANRERRAITAIGAIAVASLAWSVYGLASNPTAAYFSTLGRAWELIVGASVALAAPALVGLRRTYRELLGITGLVTLVVVVTTYSEKTLFPGLAAIPVVLGTAMLLAAGLPVERPTLVGKLLALAPLRYLGNISFSLYLWHWPVLVLTDLRAAVALQLCLALAVASYHFVEEPFRHARLWRPTKRALTLWPASLAIPAVVIAGGTAWAENRDADLERQRQQWFVANQALTAALPTAAGGSSRTDRRAPTEPKVALKAALRIADAGAPLPANLDAQAVSRDLPRIKAKCRANEFAVDSELCPTGDVDSTTTIALWGDSHAETWYDPLRKIGKRLGIRVLPLIKLGCTPFDVPQRNFDNRTKYHECDQWRLWSMAQMEAGGVDVVLIGYRGMLRIDSQDESRDELWTRGVDQTLTTLAAKAIHPIVLADWTTREMTAVQCAAKPGRLQRECISAPGGDALRANALTRPIATEHGASWVSTDKLACFKERCPLFVGETSVYADDNHYSRSWVMLNASWLQAQIEPIITNPVDPEGS